MDTTGIEHYLDVLMGGKTFDELPMPFSAVVVNLGTGQELALREGKVSKAIQASISIPGLFAPVQIGDQFYVDGGLKNQVPANVAADLRRDVIIAVSLEKDYDDPDYRRITNNLRMSITAMIEGYTEFHTAMADVLIVPDVGLDSAMDYQREPTSSRKDMQRELSTWIKSRRSFWRKTRILSLPPQAARLFQCRIQRTG